MEQENGKHMVISKTRSVILSLGFMVLLVFPTFQSFFYVIAPMPSGENRAPAKRPVLSLASIEAFPSGYESFYTDTFSLRNHLIALKSEIITRTLKKSPVPDKVLFGKEGWMYFVTNEVQEYRGSNRLSDEDLTVLVDEFTRRQAYLGERGISMYLVVAPTKYSIYPEYLPGYVDRLNDTSRTAIIKNALLQNGIRVMDLRDTLIKNKDLGLLYYKTDNHWNDLGSLITSRAIINMIRDDFPDLSPLKLEDYTIKTEEKRDGNLSQLLNMKGQFMDISYLLEPQFPNPAVKVEGKGYPIPTGFPYPWEYEMSYETPADSLPSMLLIRDSFGTSIIPFLSASFSRSVFIFDNWQYTSNEHIIDQEKPDVVVYLVLESLWNGFLDGIEISRSNLPGKNADSEVPTDK